MSYFNNYDQRKMPFSQEQMEDARSRSILDVARNLGLELVRKDSKTMTVKGYGGLVFFHPEYGNGYHWHSQDQSGDAIQFVQDWEGVDFKSAVEMILGTQAYSHIEQYQPPPPQPKKEFILPQRDDNNRQVYAYLTQTRGIEHSVVKHLFREKLLYQSKEEKNGKIYRNCAFLGYDLENTPKHCSLRSPSATYKFTQEVTGSDKAYSFSMKGKSDRIFVFEAPIDAISHASMMALEGVDWTANHLISQGGLSDKALPRYLKDYPEITDIVFCYDNDKENRNPDGRLHNQGQAVAEKHVLKYAEQGYDTYIQCPMTKDFNGDLLAYRNSLQAYESQIKELEQEGEWER